MADVRDQQIQTLFEGLALDAGRLVMAVYDGAISVSEKADRSPVTEADRASEVAILAGLRAAYPEIPCVAEEEMSAGITPSRLGHEFFLIDPLDGTKEFINRRTDFTVNIALVRDGAPVIGVVFAPCTRRFFSARPGRAELLRITPEFAIEGRGPISVREAPTPPVIVASRSHRTPETDEYIGKFENPEIVSVGSSLKFCLVAGGEADLYPRFGRTMEWDTAAGDAVLRAAGGATVSTDGLPLTYGKRNQADDSDFANPHFISASTASMI